LKIAAVGPSYAEFVEFLTLYCGLLLPWLGGAFWLAYADSRFNNKIIPNRFRQLGYGFFVGYTVLFLTIMASAQIGETVSWSGSMLFLLFFTLAGGVLAWRSHKPVENPLPSLQSTPNLPIKALTVVMMALMAVHLIFISVEIFTQAVYPWDAWLAWVYRAKAWFMVGGITDIVNSNSWATATTASTYTIDAFTYPLFPSVIPYWAALSLGHWSETLVNLPVLFAGIAIGMALYGQCREYGLSIAASLISCYLLFSIPLFGTHLALAGYADIWMAGFTGLGFVALIRGAGLHDEPGKWGLQLTLGFLMVLFSIWVKNEGAVWLLAALAMLILVMFKPRVPILMVVTATGFGLLAWALGITHVDIPLMGQLGIIDGRLVIPFIGSFALEMHNIQQVYWDNFIKMGSWNLLWVAVAASILLGFKSPNALSGYRSRRAALSFILIFLATQLFIFGFTDQGLWADTYTAINRLPLHFTPAILFAVITITHAAQTTRRRGPWPRLSTLATATTLALITITATTITTLSKDLPTTPGEAQSYPITDFKFAFGSGIPLSNSMRVDKFANGYALLSSGPVSIQADQQRVLGYIWQPPKMPQEAAFFWRRSDNPQNVLRSEISLAGAHQIDLSTEPEWKGEITEIGFLIAGVNGEAVEVGNITLIPDSLNTRLQLTWRAWASFEEWSQQSINFLYGGDYRQIVALPLLVAAWLLLTLMLFWLFARFGKSVNSQQMLTTAGMIFLLAWVLLDIRWASNNIRQIQLSIQTHAQTDDQQISSTALHGDLYQYIQRLKTEVLGDEPARILIIGDENTADYYLLRAKYHLLPHSVNVAGEFAKNQSPETLQYIIHFSQTTNITNTPGWNKTWQTSLNQIDNSEWAKVYRRRR